MYLLDILQHLGDAFHPDIVPPSDDEALNLQFVHDDCGLQYWGCVIWSSLLKFA